MLGGDIQIRWSSEDHRGDIVLDPNNTDLSTDVGLETAIIISLFTDMRAGEDELPIREVSRRGWWGDAVADIPGDQTGSKLWLLHREKELHSVAVRAKQYAEESLKWLIDSKIASKVEVESELLGNGVLGLAVKITRPGKTELTEYRYNYNWDGQEAKSNAL